MYVYVCAFVAFVVLLSIIEIVAAAAGICLAIDECHKIHIYSMAHGSLSGLAYHTAM